MDEFYYRPPDGPLERMTPSDTVTINGQPRRVSSVGVKQADEDDPELDVKAGDLMYIVEFD